MAAAPALEAAPARPASRPNIVAVGTIVWLGSELMFFSALFAMYFTIRAVSKGPWPPSDVHLNVPFSAITTTVLVLSSVTCQLGVFAAEKGDVYGLRRWFIITFFMGLFFVLGQGYEFFHENTFTISSNAFGSIYYLATGFHALHVIGGLMGFIVVLVRSTYGRFTPKKATSAIVLSYYWHFVDIVWIALYTTIYLIR